MTLSLAREADPSLCHSQGLCRYGWGWESSPASFRPSTWGQRFAVVRPRPEGRGSWRYSHRRRTGASPESRRSTPNPQTTTNMLSLIAKMGNLTVGCAKRPLFPAESGKKLISDSRSEVLRRVSGESPARPAGGAGAGWEQAVASGSVVWSAKLGSEGLPRGRRSANGQSRSSPVPPPRVLGTQGQ